MKQANTDRDEETIAEVPSLEIRVPISANDQYFRMAHCLLESIHQFGGRIARSARYVFTVSRDTPMRDLSDECPWGDDYATEFHWIDEEAFALDSYTATAYARYDIESDAEVVAMMDADTLVVGNIDDAVMRAHREQCHLGVIAQISPFLFLRHSSTPSREWWSKLFHAGGLPTPDMPYKHPNWHAGEPPAEHVYCPANYNFGFVLCPRWHAERLAGSFQSDVATVNRVMTCYFTYQVAHSMSIVRHGLKCDTLPMEYNFPLANVPETVPVDDIRVFHYLADGEIHKGFFFTDNTLLHLLERTDLSPAGRMFQARLQTVVEGIYEFES